MVLLIAVATFVSTLLGGLFALYLRDKLHLITGFAAGAVVGIAFFDLLPEALELGAPHYDPRLILSVASFGFILYLVLDRGLFQRAHAHGSETPHLLGAASLCLHSFLDGVAIGLAFQVSAAVGAVISAAVLMHDFADGINIVTLTARLKEHRARSVRWLIAAAAAPVLGAASTMLYRVPEHALAIILALFGGFFFYIGAAELIPESQHEHPVLLTTVMTALGMLALYLVVRMAGI